MRRDVQVEKVKPSSVIKIEKYVAFQANELLFGVKTCHLKDKSQVRSDIGTIIIASSKRGHGGTI